MNMIRSFGVALPGIAGALLAKLACPICWPMFAGMLAALGVAGVEYRSFGLPLGLGFVVVALGSLAFRARARRGYAPLVLGLSGAVVLMIGELTLARESLAITGVGLLIAASVWNAWPRPTGSYATWFPGDVPSR
jgi:hypothetical protein